MDLGAIFSRVSKGFASKKELPQNFLALKISSEWILATVWSLSSGKVVIGEIGSGRIKDKSYDSLLKAADEAISSALVKKEVPVGKVIFAVPYEWVSEGKIIPEHLKSLRKLCKQLDLLPLGYVIITEALENYYKETEGAPLTAVLVGIDEGRSLLTIYRAGRNLGTVPLGMETFSPENVVIAIEKALKRFNHTDILPSRIIIYNGKSDLDPIAQKITAHPWTGRLPFLHFPKVEALPAEFVVKAVAAAGGMQMGGKLEIENEFVEAVESAVPGLPSHTTEVSAGSEVEEISAEEAGFVKESNLGQISVPLSPFPHLGQLAKAAPLDEPLQDRIGTKRDLNIKQLKLLLSSIGHLLLKLLPTRSRDKRNLTERVELPVSRKLSPHPIFLIALLSIASLFLFLTFYFIPVTTIFVHVSPRDFNHQMELAVATDGKAKEGYTLLPGKTIEVSEIGTKKGVASGKKLVGDRAKGNVTIYGVAQSRTFLSGTIITSPDGLKFTLDRDATVASGDAISPATITVGVTAADIGDDYNLPSGTRFNVAGAPSQYLAKNDNAFSGGNSRQATVVTKSDQERLLATLSAELTQKAKNDLALQVAPSETLLPNAITSEVTKKKFSKDVDSEASTLNLDLSVAFKGVVFSRLDVVALFEKEFSNDIPGGYHLARDQARVDVVSARGDKEGNMLLTLNVGAQSLPQIDGQKIVAVSVGKGKKSVSDAILQMPGVEKVNLEVKPSLFSPVLDFALPLRRENLKVEILVD